MDESNQALARNRLAPIEQLRPLVKTADVVFVGKVVGVGPAPGGWAGDIAPAEQRVDYAVEEWFKGDTERDKVSVYQIVTRLQPRLVDRDTPQLSPMVFQLGNRHIVLAEEYEGRFDAMHIRPANNEDRNSIKQMLDVSH
jgi:hypothetical protein